MDWGFGRNPLAEDSESSAFNRATEELEAADTTTLQRQLSEFDQAVYGELKVQRKGNAKPQSKSKHQRLSSDRQTTRPLKQQVEEWRSSFLHLRVRGESSTVLSQERGWQFFEPPPAAASDGEAAAAGPARRGWLPSDGSSKYSMALKVANKVANMRAAITHRTTERPGLNRISSLNAGAPDQGPAAAARKPPAKKAAAPASCLAGGVELAVEGSAARILHPSREEGAGDPEEVFAQHGEFEETISQHSDNLMHCHADLSRRRTLRAGEAQTPADMLSIERREIERQLAREEEAGLPPREPVACAKHEAKAILFDKIWAELCPVLAPLLSTACNNREGSVRDSQSCGGHEEPEAGPGSPVSRNGDGEACSSSADPPVESPSTKLPLPSRWSLETSREAADERQTGTPPGAGGFLRIRSLQRSRRASDGHLLESSPHEVPQHPSLKLLQDTGLSRSVDMDASASARPPSSSSSSTARNWRQRLARTPPVPRAPQGAGRDPLAASHRHTLQTGSWPGWSLAADQPAARQQRLPAGGFLQVTGKMRSSSASEGSPVLPAIHSQAAGPGQEGSPRGRRGPGQPRVNLPFINPPRRMSRS
mmetsp:Transcript_2889/g.6784  ORF Transcript_2889/g.6784 Transcript_2889/m.6784 type:complete len:595 (+) Transcript_2889:83-1867(+)